MQVLTTRPNEEPTWGPEVYLVDHDNPHKDIGKDYDKALEIVKAAIKALNQEEALSWPRNS
jgi:hypothetical protein